MIFLHQEYIYIHAKTILPGNITNAHLLYINVIVNTNVVYLQHMKNILC